MKKLRVGFRVVESRPNKLKECPLFIRLTRDNERLEFSTGHYINPSLWSKETKKIKAGKDPVLKSINDYIDLSKVKLLELSNTLTLMGKEFSLSDIRNAFLGKEKKLHTLVSVLDKHINQSEKQQKKGSLSLGRLKRYKVFRGKLIHFLKQEEKVEDYPLSKLSPSFFNRFRDFLFSEYSLDIGTTGVYLKILNRLANVAMENEWISVNPFTACKIQGKTVDRVKLELHEIKAIEEKQFLTNRLSMIRDVFLFCIYTGLSHSDVHKLSSSNIVIGVDGNRWLSIRRTKTEVPCQIPLHPKAEVLLEKYKQDPDCVTKGRLLPVKANQKMNEYLKEIADLCGISKHLTCHIARHTFATTVCSNSGVSIETISKLLGHRSIRTTQIYARMSDQRIADEFSRIKI